MKIKQLCGIAACIVLSGAALAQNTLPATGEKARVGGLDKNRDGSLAKDEAAHNKRLEHRFGAIDANKDGQLSKDELRKHRETAQTQRRAKFDEHFKAGDTNGDGSITKAEAEAAKGKHLARNFDKTDANKDGKLSKEELHASKMKHHGKRMKKPDSTLPR
jgi:Ca2+-binding EF-hand superfamily protein